MQVRIIAIPLVPASCEGEIYPLLLTHASEVLTLRVDVARSARAGAASPSL